MYSAVESRISDGRATAVGTFLCVLALAAVPSLRAQSVTLATPVSPASGVPSVSVTLTGTGFPTGTIAPAAVTVKLEPATAGAGVTVTTPATTVTTVAGTTRRVVFSVPPVLVSAATPYLISLSGVTSTNTAFASANKAAFTLNPAPALTSILPRTGVASQSVAVVLNAQLTNFVQGVTVASFGAGVSVGTGLVGGFGPVIVIGPTKALAVVQIPAGTAAGARDVKVATGTDQVSLAGAFTVQASGATPASSVISLNSPTSPDAGLPGVTPVTVTATNFPADALAPGQISVLLEPETPGAGPALTTSATSVTDVAAGTRSVTFVIPATYSPVSPVSYFVSVYGSTSGFGALQAGFTFASANRASLTIGQTASLLSANPNTGVQGGTLEVTLTGQGTHFAQGQTKANFGQGIGVGGSVAANFGAVTVTSATTATAHIQIDSAATTAARTIQVTTGGEAVALTGAFTVQASVSVPALTSVTPSSGQRGQAVQISISGANTSFGPATAINAGAGISVSNVGASSPTALSALLTIASDAVLGSRPITVTTGAQTVGLAGAFTVLAAAPTPTISSISPATGTTGSIVLVTITGANTSFNASSVPDLGAGISFANVTAVSATSLTASAIISPGATPGARTLKVTTGSQVASLAAAFSVQSASPGSISSLIPATGTQGASLAVAIVGQSTSFAQGSSTADFGAGISVSSLTVADATHATAQITIAPNAAPGMRNVAVTTGGLAATLSAGFTVQMSLPATISSVTPASGLQGASVQVAINGQNTSFSQGSTTADFGASINVNSLSVVDVTHATAQVVIAGNAAPGARTVTLTTGTQTATLASGFTVQAGSPGSISAISPSVGVLGASFAVAILGTGTSFAQGATVADFGTGVTVNSLTITDATHATAQITIGASAPAGAHDVRLTTNNLLALLANGFTVSGPGPQVTILTPANNSLFNSSPINVTGTVSDPTATVRINGVTATVSGTSFSARVPLAEAANTLVVTATNSAGITGSASTTVSLDTTPPTIGVDSPTNGAMLTSTSVTVSGMVNDIVSGTVNAQQVSVTVNGLPAAVSNRSFEIQNLLLVRGENTITAVATDRAGNKTTSQLKITVQTQSAQQTISIISGNSQTAQIGAQLPKPMVVQLLDGNSNPVPNRTVTFTVRRSDGMILASGQTAQTVTLTTDSKGFAQVLFQVGTHVGAGMNQVQVTSPGFMGETILCATTTPGAAVAIRSLAEITSVPVGVVGQALSKPLRAIALDSGGNPVPGTPVVFTVQQGGGNFAGQTSTTVSTDSDGNASAVFTLGMQEGISNNVVTASLQQLPSESVSFQASGVFQGASAATTLSGVALDNSNVPVPHAQVTVLDTALSTFTDDQGRFKLTGVPPGFVILKVDGATSTRPEKIPFLTYPLEIIAGLDNSLGKPAYLPFVDLPNSRTVGGNQDVVLTMAGVPGVAFTVFANSVTFPDGSHVGSMSLSQVHADKVPHAPPYGTVPKVVWTLQPAGAVFSSPIRVQLPNTDNLAPGQVVEVFQIDHDLHQFVSIGNARVSADGSVLTTDVGFGITKAGWGVPAPPPPPKKCVGGCGDCKTCKDGACVNANEGGSCNDKNDCTTNDKCKSGACVGDPVMITKVDGACVAAKGAAASFTATANDTSHVMWSAPAGTPTTGMGATFSTTFAAEGSTVVTAMCMASSQSKMVDVGADCSTVTATISESQVAHPPGAGAFGQVTPMSNTATYTGCVKVGKWCFALNVYTAEYGFGTQSLGKTPISGAGDPTITPANCATVIADLTPPAAGAGHGPPRGTYYSPSITLDHENFHVSDLRSAVWTPVLNDLKAFVAMAANCTECKTAPPAAFDTKLQALYTMYFNTFFPMAEQRAHNFSNPEYTALIAGIRARAMGAPAAAMWPAACK